jgi:predicted nucleic acid-binding protein
MELADTSAWTNRHKSPATREEFSRLLMSRQLTTCEPVNFELLWSELDTQAVERRRIELEALPTAPVEGSAWSRAADVFELLAARGPLHHRQVGLVDLLVAAAADLAGIAVLHYDRHFELIAEVTGQPVRAIAPLGSL